MQTPSCAAVLCGSAIGSVVGAAALPMLLFVSDPARVSPSASSELAQWGWILLAACGALVGSIAGLFLTWFAVGLRR